MGRYLESTRTQTEAVVSRLFADVEPEPAPEVTLTEWDPDGEDKVLAAICYPYSSLPRRSSSSGCAGSEPTNAERC